MRQLCCRGRVRQLSCPALSKRRRIGQSRFFPTIGERRFASTVPTVTFAIRPNIPNTSTSPRYPRSNFKTVRCTARKNTSTERFAKANARLRNNAERKERHSKESKLFMTNRPTRKSNHRKRRTVVHNSSRATRRFTRKQKPRSRSFGQTFATRCKNSKKIPRPSFQPARS